MRVMLVMAVCFVFLNPLGAAVGHDGTDLPATPLSFSVSFSPDSADSGFMVDNEEVSQIGLELDDSYCGGGKATLWWDIIYYGTETLDFSIRAEGPLKIKETDADGIDWDVYGTEEGSSVRSGGLYAQESYSWSLVVQKKAENIREKGSIDLGFLTEDVIGFDTGSYSAKLYFGVETQ